MQRDRWTPALDTAMHASKSLAAQPSWRPLRRPQPWPMRTSRHRPFAAQPAWRPMCRPRFQLITKTLIKRWGGETLREHSAWGRVDMRPKFTGFCSSAAPSAEGRSQYHACGCHDVGLHLPDARGRIVVRISEIGSLHGSRRWGWPGNGSQECHPSRRVTGYWRRMPHHRSRGCRPICTASS